MYCCFCSLSAGEVLARVCDLLYWHGVLPIKVGLVSTLASCLLVIWVLLKRLPICSRRFVVIPTKVHVSNARHGKQCQPSGPLLTWTLGSKKPPLHMLILSVDHCYIIFSYRRDLTTKHKHTILVISFFWSIFVQWCALLLYFMVSRRRQVYSCASNTPANHYATRVMLYWYLLPYFPFFATCVRVHGWRSPTSL